jgi:diaminopimelate epimerase
VTRSPIVQVNIDKYEAVGNDFLILLDEAGEACPTPELARRLCDRHRGVGADGLIWCGRATAGDAPFVFELWNADGSQAEMSGNGIRCLVHALADAGMVDGWTAQGAGAAVEVAVATPAGTKLVALRRTEDPAEAWGSVDMGMVTVHGEADRCNVGYGQLLVDVGNPHLVVLGPHPATVDVAGLGPELERSQAGGVNVEFVALGPGPDELTMRVYERGVGETLACGTGSVAAAAALAYWGRVGTKVTVHQPGGAVEVNLRSPTAAGTEDGALAGRGEDTERADEGGQPRLTATTLSGPSRRIARCQVEAGPAELVTPGESAVDAIAGGGRS